MPLVTIIPGKTPQQLFSLKGAETEAQNIASSFTTTVLIGVQATKFMVVERMKKSRIIHLATHGNFDANQGNKSWVALATDSLNTADNGLLTAEEIVNLNLKSELVVLSACGTGRGKIGGDGVISLSCAFISAGSASVLVFLWSVDDNITAFIMEQFYQNWHNGDDKAKALRDAMLAGSFPVDGEADLQERTLLFTPQRQCVAPLPRLGSPDNRKAVSAVRERGKAGERMDAPRIRRILPRGAAIADLWHCRPKSPL